MACLFGHKWNGCKCEKCGKTRDEQHDWDLCKGNCKICGKPCDIEHKWNGCKCSNCGKTRDEHHNWYGCKCTGCGKIRDEQHYWLGGCKCSGCGKIRGEQHDWNGCICSNCGKIRDEQHSWRGKKKCSICGKPRTFKDDIGLMVDLDWGGFDKLYTQEEFAFYAKYADAREHDAFERLTDQDLIADVAQNAENQYVRLSAADKLTDRNIAQQVYVWFLEDVFLHCTAEYSISTINKLTDKKMLLNIINDKSQKYVLKYTEDVGTPDVYEFQDCVEDLRIIARKRLEELNRSNG